MILDTNALSAFAGGDQKLFDVLPIGEETARRYADIRRELKAAALPIPSNDVWIAALAREHRSPVASRDQHFRAVKGLRLVTWQKARRPTPRQRNTP